MLIGAHRGDTNPLDGFPENTLEAVAQAAQRGADAIEFDVQKTMDGVWFLMHNETISGTTTGTGDINDITAQTVEAATIDGGKGYLAARHVGLRVPRLDVVLSALSGYTGTAFVHMKDSTTAWHAELAQFCAARFPVEQTIIIVDTLGGAGAIKTAIPSMTTACLDSTSDAKNVNINIHLAEQHYLTTAWMATQPKPVWSYGAIALWGTDESVEVERAYVNGALGYLGNHVRVNEFVRGLVGG